MRKKRDDLPFFSHDNDARNHPKMRALIAQYGAAGYGHFWMLNELIAHAKKAKLDLSKKINRGAAAQELGMNLPDFEAFLAWIIDPEIDLARLEDGFLTTDRTQKDITLVEKRRDVNKNYYVKKNDSDSYNDDSESEKNDSESDSTREREREREGEFSKSERSVVAISESGETTISPDAPRRRFSIDDLRKEIQDCPIPLTLSAKELETILANFDAAGLSRDELKPYLAYAAERARRQSKGSTPNGYFRNVLVKWVDWIVAFRDERPKPKTRATPKAPEFPAPTPCDCGEPGFAWDGRDVARCKGCGSIWEYDPEIGWIKTREGESENTA